MIQRLLFLALIFTTTCKNSTQPDQVKASLNKNYNDFLENYYKQRLNFFPIEATYAGDSTFNNLLPNDISQEYKKSLKDFYAKIAMEMKAFDYASMTEDDKMSYDLLKWECDIKLKESALEKELLPLNQFESMHLIMGTFASGKGSQPFKTIKDYDNWLQRLDAYSIWLDTALVNMKHGISKKIVLPASLTLKMIPQFEDLSSQTVSDHLFNQPIKNLPASFDNREKTRLATAFETMIGEKLLPRFRTMRDFLKKEYLAASRKTSGFGDLPFGKEYYDDQIKLHTTTNMTAEEIHQLGLNEVERLSNEMKKVMEQVGFKGTLKEFFDHVRTKKELMPFTNPQQVIDNFNAIHDRMKPNLSKLFDVTPKTRFEVRRTEAFREASASAEYIQGTFDGSRPGVFYVPIPDVKKYNVYGDEDLFLHEAIPGHHYQVSLQQENSKLPSFRKNLWYTAYGEGWALYSESLGKELGLYTDPFQYFGMLGAEMHRAIRLVVDSGIHSKAWSREKAIQYSLDHEAESEESIVAEVERYMAWPGQALGYKIGQLKILELRNKLQEKQGKRFDIKKFHNDVLMHGCLPLAVLENTLLSTN